MGIKDKIGQGITNFIYPYMQNYYKQRGETMPKQCDEREKFELQEKYLWFLGDENLLADFYHTRRITTSIVDTRAEYYYSKLGANIRIIHSGMPSLISYSKARLLQSGGIKLKVEKNEIEDVNTTKLLKAICKDNKIDSIIKNSITTESWGKRFAWKISSDVDISEYPIIEMYKPFDYEANYKRGRLQSIIFKNHYEKDRNKFELQETYGKGYIDYKLFMINDNKLIEYPLSELIETAELKRVDFDKKIMLANEKCLDKSDYCGIISEFDALDEAWSQWLDEIRLARSEVYVPEMLMEKQVFDKFRKNYTTLGTDMHENGENKITHVQPDIRSTEYANTAVKVTNNILVNVGLSPYTVGIDDAVGANASGDSLTKREMTSLRTRKEMIISWKEFLEETYTMVLIAYDYFQNKLYTEYDVDAEFGKYISPTQSEVIDDTKKLKDSSIIDVEKALDDVYGDTITDEEKTRIINSFNIISPQELDNFNGNNKNITE